jgi:hypothetical protein
MLRCFTGSRGANLEKCALVIGIIGLESPRLARPSVRSPQHQHDTLQRKGIS